MDRDTGLLNVGESREGIGAIMSIERFSTYEKFIKSTAYILLLVENLKFRTRIVADETDKSLNTAQMEKFKPRVEILWILEAQSGGIKKEWKEQFTMFCDVHNIWRCSGQLDNAELPYDVIHSIVLPQDHLFTLLVVRRAHCRVIHSGFKNTLTEIKSRYWIRQGKSIVRRFIYQCVLCRRYSASSYNIPPPPLPQFRVKESSPFTTIGVDYAENWNCDVETVVPETVVPDASAEEGGTTSRRPRRRAATEARDSILARLMENQIHTHEFVCPVVADAPDIHVADASEVPDTPEATDNNLCSKAVDQIFDGSLCDDSIADAVTVKSAPDSIFVCTPYETDFCEIDGSINLIFIGESGQLVKFINEINNATCLVPNCSGKLQLHAVEQAGMGGAAAFLFHCTSCGNCKVNLNTSSERENGSPALSAALQVAFICAGAFYVQYRRVLCHAFGMQNVSSNTFYGRIEEMYEHVKAILDDICFEERQQMKDMNQNQLGSWSRAVTCADAVWLTRGSLNRNCMFTVRNYMTCALLYYYHICQKGKDTLCKEDLYEGSLKSAEGL
uniref:Uncharacterized protein n=1 Tax=Amphimedon queenslandica TaxID=400682 RepID=A0A1X7VS14_AMPQE